MIRLLRARLGVADSGILWRSSNLQAVVLSLALLIASGVLFWLMIRAMGRMLAPRE